ncbi:MAG: VTT domain-containing protein, partial [archaeon]
MNSFFKKRKAVLLFLTAFTSLVLILSVASFLVSKNPVLIPLLKNFVQQHGLMGGFAVSFTGSLWFVLFPHEIILAPILRFYEPAYVAILVFAFGAVFADTINFFSGRYLGEAVLHKRIKPEKLAQIQGVLDRWGMYTLILFGFVGPVTSYDLLALVLGAFSKMKFRTFIAVTIPAR